VTGPQSERANYSYSAAGRLEAVTHQRSGAALALYTYNADHQLLDVKRIDGTTVVTSTPDIKGRTTSVSDPLDNLVTLGYTGDSRSPNSVQLPTPNRPAISIQRNTKEQPTIITDPAVPGAAPIAISYNAANRVTQVTDEAGRAIEADYDTEQNLETVRRFLGATPVEVGYGYLNGYLKTLTDPLNKTWTTNRDTYGRVTSIVDPTNITLSMEYDSLGRLWRITDPRLSSPITYTFDSLDRILTITTPAGVTTYTYDPMTKWLASITDVQNRTVSFTHDAANGDITKSSYITALSGGGTKTLEINYSFARFGDLETVAAPESTPVNFDIDDLGRAIGSNETDSGLYDAPRGFVSNNAQDGVWTNVRNHIFTWGAPESASPVNGYSFAQDVTAPQTVTTTAPNAAWNNVSDGQHTARVRAKNTAGFWGPEAVFSLRIDTVNPLLSDWTITPTSTQNGLPVTVGVNFTDALSGVMGQVPPLRWCISGDATRPWNSYLPMITTSGNSWIFPITSNWGNNSEKKLYYQVEGSDVTGNIFTNPEQSLTISGEFAITAHTFVFTNGNVVGTLTWNSTIGASYQIETSTSMTTWAPCSPIFNATAQTTTRSTTPISAGTKNFYRIHRTSF
jgi:YD repeat-containing protein